MFFPELKSRTEPSQPIRYWETQANGFAPWVRSAGRERWTTESIMSQCHTGSWSKKRDAPRARTEGDVGGFMELTRVSDRDISLMSESGQSTSARGQLGFAQMIGNPSDGLGTVATASRIAMDTYGTSAIAAVLPTNPNSSLSTALGEVLRDGLPRLPGADLKDNVARSRAAGSEYLNIEFGWLPLVSDLKRFMYAVKHARTLIDQYTRDSDRKIRRRHSLPPQSESSVVTGTCISDGALFGPGSMQSTLETRYWFSGAFRYHVPVDSEFMGRLRRYEAYADFLFGTRITPEVVWELAPWSWAVDWFTNAGDVIHNISRLGSDGLVMQYGYAMRHSRKVNTWVMTLPTARGVARTERVTETKQRVAANPYGFGIDDTSLNAVQLAILAALGLSRGQRDNTRL